MWVRKPQQKKKKGKEKKEKKRKRLSVRGEENMSRSRE
jgi:hypothetical protein